MFKSITHVIFDMDGLLLDTESLNERVNRTIVQRYGKEFITELKIAILGRSTFDSAEIIVNRLNLPLSPEQYLQERTAMLYPLYPKAKALPGAKKLTTHFWQNQIPQAIASSSWRANFERKTLHHQDWLKHFSVITLGDDPQLKSGKPAPDIFLLTAARLQAQPANCLVFEDSLAGMKAAIAAGMSVVVVPDPVLDPTMFAAADQVISSITEFNPLDWGLP